MMTKRSFFRRFGAIIAAVALAPEIAFGVRLPIQQTLAPTLDLYALFDAVYDLMRARMRINVVGDAMPFDRQPLGILEQLQRMPRPIDVPTPPPVFCKDCGKEGMDLCMSCYDKRIDAYV